MQRCACLARYCLLVIVSLASVLARVLTIIRYAKLFSLNSITLSVPHGVSGNGHIGLKHN